jgi:hypothetical protein
MNIIDEESYPLIVRRVQPEHPIKDTPGFLEAAQAPKAQTESVHATEEWPIINPAPWQHPVKTRTE